MPLDRLAAEAALEPVHELACERDFRQHDHDLPALFECARDGLEIDFGLARTGDAVEQRYREVPAVDRRPQRLDRDPLMLAELRDRMRWIGPAKRALRYLHLDEQSGLHQPIDHAGRNIGRECHRRFCPDQAILGGFHRLQSCRRHPLRPCGTFRQSDA